MSQQPRNTNPPPPSQTLTLSIPFTLLIHTTALSPSNPPISPRSLVLKTLHRFCSSVPIRAWPLARSPPHARPAPNTSTWLLRAGPHTILDTALAPDEAARLTRRTWAVSLELFRGAVPRDTRSSGWAMFADEVRGVLGVLRQAFEGFEGEGGGRMWDVVFGARSVVRVGVGAEKGAAKGVVVLVAGFERELDCLRGVGEVGRFMGVGRWLEGVLLRGGAGRRRDGGVRRVGVEGGREREREWWDVVHGMEGEEMVMLMRKWEEHGVRLGVSVHSRKDGTAEVVVQGQHSTLDAEYLVAYTKLIAHFVNVAHRYDADGLASQLELLQLNPPTKLPDRFARMLDFLGQEGREGRDAMQATLLARMAPISRPDSPLQMPTPTRPDRPRRAVDPFYNLRTYLEANHARSRKDMVQFMERYESAGGYMPTTEERLSAILDAEEERLRREGKEVEMTSKTPGFSVAVDAKSNSSLLTEGERAVVKADEAAKSERVRSWVQH
ncbi:hypothetical protein C7974DRAFT_374297 [Boeremia exigua]|uniref:uncharacterized protein n=1 Tax=Boeremia exigua TaxID=749465 RepID=UPI001E8EE5AD|nr:uncharacterized protein C7974DRAFT_374297 [Boeremia exigua]KAH6637626.1 hypothetical protein C7974DRAFT_374297 [Boeremia exigua]